MSDEIERARAVLSAATPGPWRVNAPSDGVWAPNGGADGEGDEITDRTISDRPMDDARAIALLGSCWPELLAVVEAARRARVAHIQSSETRDLFHVLDALSFGVQPALDALRARLREHLGGDDG